MDQQFWLEKWQKNDIGFHRNEPNYFLAKYFNELGLPINSNVLVPLCGKSLDMLWLADNDCKVIGCELSSLASLQFYRENYLDYELIEDDRFSKYSGDDISILCGDFFLVKQGDLGVVDFCYDRAALVALPAAILVRYAHHLAGLLPSGAKYLLEIKTYHCNSEIGPPFSISSEEVFSLFGDNFLIEFLESQPEAIRPDSTISQHGASELTNSAYLLIKK
jgi:thiopurine S-methyltransferase